MRGFIRPKGKRSWQIQVYIDSPEGRKRHFETVRGLKNDAQRRLNELLVSMEKGIPVTVGRLTVEEHLKQWLNGYVKTKCSQRTLDGYRSIVVRHLIPALGKNLLKHLNQQAIQNYYGVACETLSARTVHHHHRVLSQSLKYAVRQGYLGRNPCEMVDAPRARKKIMRTLTPGELEKLLDNAVDSYYYPVIYTAVSLGLRQAELLGLRWRDIDLEMLSVSVSRVLYKRGGTCEFKEPKTDHSRRNVAMTPKLAIFLREYKAQRNQFYQLLGKDMTLDDLVFANESGKPMDPSILSHSFSRIAKKSGLGTVRFHDLRHTFASLLLLRGAKPKVISEALGHASVAFTMDTYSHIINGMQEEAMALLDTILPAGVSKDNGGKTINANLTPTVDIKTI